jgi:hypothetical protein
MAFPMETKKSQSIAEHTRRPARWPQEKPVTFEWLMAIEGYITAGTIIVATKRLYKMVIT